MSHTRENAASLSLGRSSLGYTPQGQRDLAPTDLSGTAPYRVEGLSRPTIIHIRPSQLPAKQRKYALLGAVLVPLRQQVFELTPYVPKAKRKAKPGRKPRVVALVDAPLFAGLHG